MRKKMAKIPNGIMLMTRHVVVFRPNDTSIGLFIPRFTTYFDLRCLLERICGDLTGYCFAEKSSFNWTTVYNRYYEEEAVMDSSAYLVKKEDCDGLESESDVTVGPQLWLED
jgi:hypothetical protein